MLKMLTAAITILLGVFLAFVQLPAGDGFLRSTLRQADRVEGGRALVLAFFEKHNNPTTWEMAELSNELRQLEKKQLIAHYKSGRNPH